MQRGAVVYLTYKDEIIFCCCTRTVVHQSVDDDLKQEDNDDNNDETGYKDTSYSGQMAWVQKCKNGNKIHITIGFYGDEKGKRSCDNSDQGW